jgi:hypothetical protein
MSKDELNYIDNLVYAYTRILEQLSDCKDEKLKKFLQDYKKIIEKELEENLKISYN